MANFKNTEYHQLTVKDTFPFSDTKTGTMSVTGTQGVGVGTLFLTELHIGDWIFVAAQDELRQVTSIADNLHFTIDKPFTANIAAGASVVVTPKSVYKEIAIVIPPLLNNGEIDGIGLYAGVPVNFGKNGRDNSGQADFIDPLIIDGTGTEVYIQALK